MSEQYDLKKSEEGIGQLYPILEAKDGEIIDGFHREEVNKNWKRVRLENIDTEEKKLVARLVANFHRRIVPYEEKKRGINGLAEILSKQDIGGIPISQKLCVITGIPTDTIREYLEVKYKARKHTKPLKKPPRVPASQAIETAFPKRGYGKQLVERHRVEVLAEEKPKIEHEVKAKLLKSPEFQREVIREIQKPQFVKPTEPCPSGVCELPSRIESGEPIDVRAEALKEFWENNPECQCKKCEHYGKCGVIR